MYYVYVLKRSDGSPFYVGAGLMSRIMSHFNGTGRRPLVDAIFREHKDNCESVSYTIDSEHKTKESAFSREIELIAEIGKISDGGTLVNICDGGAGSNGYRASQEERKANSDRVKEYYSDPESRKRTSILTKKAMEDERIRSHISSKLKERWSDKAYREKLIKSHTGRKDSEETKSRKAESCAKSWESGARVGKYTDDQIADVYSRKGKEKAVDVAKIYGMNPTYVHKIWRHERCIMNLKRLGVIE
ncbi:hypothetical protein [Vibrio phage vB_VcM_SY]